MAFSPGSIRPVHERLRLTLDVDRQPAIVIAFSLFAVQVTLFLLGRLIDLAMDAEVDYGFIFTMLLLAGLVLAAGATVATLAAFFPRPTEIRPRTHLSGGEDET